MKKTIIEVSVGFIAATILLFAGIANADRVPVITSSGATTSFAYYISSVVPWTVPQGGTGSTTLTGILKGNGTGGVQTAIPGVDYLTSSSGAASTTLLVDKNTFSGVNNFAQASTTNLEMTLYADNFSGSDIGAKINAAYSACGIRGCIIVVPSGSYTFSTEIQINTNNKSALIQCAPGNMTLLNYTGTATSTLFNVSQGHKYAWGMTGCELNGPGSTGNEGTTAGIELGGANGAEGVVLSGIRVLHFGNDLALSSNTWSIDVTQSGFSDANHAVLYEGGSTNFGERLNFNSDVFFNNDNDVDNIGSIADKCIIGGSESSDFTDDVFDACNFYAQQTVSTSITGGDFENPGAVPGNSPFIYISTSTISNLNVTNVSFTNDSSLTTTNPYAFITDYGDLHITNVTLFKNGTQVPTNFVFTGGVGSFTITNLFTQANSAIACTNVYDSASYPTCTTNGGHVDQLNQNGTSGGSGFSLLSNGNFTFNAGGASGGFFNSGNLWTFPNGIISQASSTIGDGTQTGGLTINGGATTTKPLFVSGNSNQLLIGTNTGSTTPYIYTDGSQPGYIDQVCQNTNDSGSGGCRLVFSTNTSGGTFTAGGMLAVTRTDSPTGGSSDMDLWTSLGAVLGDRVKIKGAGTVGISTTTPYSLLDVEAVSGTVYPGNTLLRVASSTAGAWTNLFSIDINGNHYSGGATPTVSNCGSSSIIGDNTNGVITLAGTDSSCYVVFANGGFASTTVLSKTVCTMNDSSTLTLGGIAAASSTSVQLAYAANITGTAWYHCEEHN